MSLLSLFILFGGLIKVVFGCNMYGLAYTPYRELGLCPTVEEAEEDAKILLKHTTRVRTYTTLCQSVNRVLLRYASEGKLSILFGVWIDGVPDDQLEIDHLMEALREFPHASLEGIAVGNEVAFRGSMTVHEVAEQVKEMRTNVRALGHFLDSESLLNVPVFTIDIIPKPELVEASDVVAVNIHPFYRLDLPQVDDPEEMAERIVEASAEQINIYRNLAPFKKLIVTEIGWPTNSVETEANVGDPLVAKYFMQKFTEFASMHELGYYFFEIFDSDWKKEWFVDLDERLSEFNWGLYYGDRTTPKFSECR